jgi:hypothetical protein
VSNRARKSSALSIRKIHRDLVKNGEKHSDTLDKYMLLNLNGDSAFAGDNPMNC